MAIKERQEWGKFKAEVAGSCIVNTIRYREDFESLIEDNEFATAYAQAVSILCRGS